LTLENEGGQKEADPDDGRRVRNAVKTGCPALSANIFICQGIKACQSSSWCDLMDGFYFALHLAWFYMPA